MSSTALGAWVLPLAMFLGTFAWSFVFVSLPFHILAISSWDATATLRWTGWILGVSPLVTATLLYLLLAAAGLACLPFAKIGDGSSPHGGARP
jgi:hypothetical protein